MCLDSALAGWWNVEKHGETSSCLMPASLGNIVSFLLGIYFSYLMCDWMLKHPSFFYLCVREFSFFFVYCDL